MFAHVLGDVANGRRELVSIVETGIGHLEPTLTLDEDLRRAVDHDFADRRVVEERPDGRKKLEQRLVENVFRNHRTSMRRDARASSACSPLGEMRRYSRNSPSACTGSPR